MNFLLNEGLIKSVNYKMRMSNSFERRDHTSSKTILTFLITLKHNFSGISANYENSC